MMKNVIKTLVVLFSSVFNSPELMFLSGNKCMEGYFDISDVSDSIKTLEELVSISSLDNNQ